MQSLLVISLLTASSLAQTVVRITAEPDHHLVLTNDYVRVFEVEVPPNAETLYHQHDYDYLYVAIGDADVTSTRLHEKPVSVKLKNGEVELAKAPFAHKATNNTDRPFRNVTIEVLGGVGTPICGVAGGEKSCGGIGSGSLGTPSEMPDLRPHSSDIGAEFLMKSSILTVARVVLHGKVQIELTQLSRGPGLLVPLSRVNLTSTSQNSTRELSAPAGEPVWISDTEATLSNAADSAKFILVSFSATKPH